MPKHTLSTHLPKNLEAILATVGEQIKLARLRRRLSLARVAETASCSELTLIRIEKGSPKVSFGTYARVLLALGLEKDLLLIAQADETGRMIQDASLIYKNKEKNGHGTAKEFQFD